MAYPSGASGEVFTCAEKKDFCVNVIPPNFRAAFSGGRERWLIWLLCLAAGWRVFIYSAAFPFFNNVDEQSHFDLVVKYAQGQPPHGLEKFSTESARYFVMCGSPEYLLTPDRFPGGKFPSPPWTRPVENIAGQLLPQIAQWESKTNHESSQPPLYYAAAGLWMRLGQSCGQQDCFLLYWIRFLNVPLAALLVWLGFIAAKIIFPEQIFPRLAVPVLLAFISQDVFYSIQNDVLSPLCFGAAFICVLRWWQTDTPTPRLALATALCLVASCLVKTTNLPAVAVAGAALLFNARADLPRQANCGIRWRRSPCFFSVRPFPSRSGCSGTGTRPVISPGQPQKLNCWAGNQSPSPRGCITPCSHRAAGGSSDRN